MPSEQANRLIRHIRCLVTAKNQHLPDHGLLERFGTERDDQAFEALVLRHGPMVLRVCQGVLKDTHAAEDAFQATFLVLLRKYTSIRKRRSVQSWLYKVAYHVALCARRASHRRQCREARAVTSVAPDVVDEVTWQELRAIFDEELQRLAEKYRGPVILCCLEGRTRDEAAQELGWSLGTLKGRLERGRQILRARLVRRGVSLATGLGATLLSEGSIKASVPPSLVNKTVRVAAACLPGRSAEVGAISAEVQALVHGVIRTMALSRLNLIAACFLAAGVLMTGAGVAAHQAWAAKQPHGQPDARSNANPDRPDQPIRTAQKPDTDQNGDPLPADAITRLGTLRFRHMHSISSVAYSADGKRLASGSLDGTVRLWDAATGEELHRFTESKDGISSAAVSPDGTVVAAGNMKRTLFLWDAVTGKEIRRVEGLENTAFGLRFATNGKTLAGVSGSVAHIWDVATGKEQSRLVGAKDDWRPFTFSPDLTTLASVSDDRSLHLWDLGTGKEFRQFPSGHEDWPFLDFSFDGKTLATAAGTGDGAIRLWDPATGKKLKHFGPAKGTVVSAVFAPDGTTLAAGEEEGAIAIYDVSSGKERCRCSLSDDSGTRALAFSPDGATLALGGTGRKAIRFFDTATGKALRRHTGHQDEIMAAFLAADGKSVISAAKDGVIAQWDAAKGTETRSFGSHPISKCIHAMDVTPDGKTLATAGDSNIHLWDLAAGKETAKLSGHKVVAEALAFNADGKMLASGSWQDHTIRLWDVARGEERLRITLPMPNGHNYGDVPLVFSRDGKVLYSGSADRANPSLYFWDSTTGKEIRRIARPVSRLALSPDGKTLATASWDKRIYLWDVATGAEITQIEAPASALAFSPDGRMLAYGATNGVIHLLEMATRRERHVFAGHQPGGNDQGSFAAGVAVLAFSPDGRTLISGGGDTTLLLWDVFGTHNSGRLERPTAKQIEAAWADLADDDASKAYQGARMLMAASTEAAGFWKERLQPAVAIDAAKIAKLIGNLDSNEFAVREQATNDLVALKRVALPALRKALQGQPSEEARRRLEQVQQALEGLPAAEELRDLRAIEILEHLDTPKARGILEYLAKGEPDARVTEAAKASLERVTKQSDRTP
jgi:RNA polymerase sigma factor (sigma-70 family)